MLWQFVVVNTECRWIVYAGLGTFLTKSARGRTTEVGTCVPTPCPRHAVTIKTNMVPKMVHSCKKSQSMLSFCACCSYLQHVT